MQTLYGRVTIVVAASDGVGAAIARCFGELGASVVVNYASDKASAERVVGVGLVGPVEPVRRVPLLLVNLRRHQPQAHRTRHPAHHR